jgi:ATP-dependent Clp protease ATP-binding subunit ClpB
MTGLISGTLLALVKDEVAVGPGGNQGGDMKTTEQKPKTMKAAAGLAPWPGWETLNAGERCDEAGLFESELFARLVAQDEAVMALSQLYQLDLARLTLPGKPIGTLLFLGPTGSGKTRAVEAAAEILFGDPRAMIKVDCGEFQHSHEIAKLIGSPPGYLGHRETQPMLSQENLDRFHTAGKKLTFVLFDEIEKASDALWQMLLGVLDKASLTLGDNRRVDFSRCVIVLTSNLGAREMSVVTEGSFGFAPGQTSSAELDAKLQKIGVEAARRKFSPEFINRLDRTVVFQTLSDQAMRRILDLELLSVQRRILDAGCGAFVLQCGEQAKEFLLRIGFDRRYGARPLKRAIEKYLVMPLSNLIATRQLSGGDLLFVDRDEEEEKFCFRRSRASVINVGASAARGTRNMGAPALQ